ncbi:MAG: site-specific integrase [Bacteroidales bacterium]|nr:site-specific integrase [Bacteroidales bacterium]
MSKVNSVIMFRPDRPKVDKTYPVVLRVTIQREVKYIPLGFDVLKKDFDAKKETVRTSDPNAHKKRLAITSANTKVNAIERHFLVDDINPTMKEFVRLFNSNSFNNDSFYDYIDEVKRTKQGLSYETLIFYEKQTNKLKMFSDILSIGYVNSKDFIIEYREFLINNLGNKEITWNKSLEFVRRILNQALKDERITRNVFIHFPLKNPKGTFEPFTVKEVKSLRGLYDKKELATIPQEVLRYFLFACYTGMRWRDIKELRWENFKLQNGTTWVEFIQHKTQKPARLPLIPQAIGLLPQKGFDKQKVFSVKGNEARYLKPIKEKLGIPGNKPFHSARSTVNTILLSLDVPIEVREMIVGDTKEVIRNHYTKDNEEMIKGAMERMSLVLTANTL